MPDSIAYGGLTFRPTRYADRTDEDGLAINFQATLSSDETARLRSLIAEGRVYRAVAFASRTEHMRFGLVLWHRRDDGDIEHDITLVGEGYDRQMSPRQRAMVETSNGEPALSNVTRTVARLSAELRSLVDAMANAGSLDRDTVERARRAGDEAERDHRYAFDEVPNVSDLVGVWTFKES